MRILQTKDLKPGMVTAKPIVTKKHQVIVSANVELTRILINHIEFYNIKEAAILDNSPELISSQQSVKETIECKHFKNTFLDNLDYLKAHINDVILRNEDPDGQPLLAQMLALFDSVEVSINIYDILHTLRKKDGSTYAHSINVAVLCRLMGQWLDFEQADIDILTLCGLLHDIGKIKVSGSILSKPGSLTDEEYAVIKRHSLNGYEILKDLPLDSRIKRAALMHHERCDGSGYPLGLVREDIDPFSVIVSIADVYDAMTSKRCYRDAICPFEVIATFEKEGFRKYNESYVTTFLNHIVDSYMNDNVLLSNGSHGQIVWKNREQLARPTIYLPNREFVDLSKHPEINIKEII